MKKYILSLALLGLLFAACEKTETVQFGLTGTLKGEIRTINELGITVFDWADITVTLEGSDPIITTKTDSIGEYELHNVPTGTYNLVFSKEGYGDYRIEGFQFVGGDEPYYRSGTLIEISKTTFEDLAVELVDTNRVMLKGIIHHNHENTDWFINEPRVLFVFHDQDNVSETNYTYNFTSSIQAESGAEFEYYVTLNRSVFPAGTTVYIMLYGLPETFNVFREVMADKYIYSSTGKPSDRVSIVLP